MKALKLLPFILLYSCGGTSNGTDTVNQGSLGASPYITVDSGNLSPSGMGIKGQGAVAFKNSVGEIGARKSYSITFSLDDGGSLTLVANADETLKNGVEVKFTRTGNSVAAAMLADSKTSAAKNFPSISGAQQITLTVDIHNNEVPAHILIWSGNDFTSGNALLNSETDDAAPGQGRGTFWGLKLNQATVTDAVVGAPKFVGE